MFREWSKLLIIFLLINILYSIEEEGEFYRDLLIHPMDLNTTKFSYLNQLLQLNEKQSRNFENFRKNNFFKSIYELTNFGLSIENIEKISPYIRIKNPPEKELFFFFRYITKEKNNTNQNIFESEIQIKELNIFYGINSKTNILEKEQSYFLSNSVYNFSFENELINFVIGHYQLSFGQNLLFGTGSINYIDDISKYPIHKKTRGIVRYKNPNKDSDNNKIFDYLDGIALNLKIKNLFFPYLSIAKQLIKTNTNFHITTALIYRENIEAGCILSYNSTNTNEYSFFYDFPLTPLFNPYGEIAISDGLSIVQGIKTTFEETKISGLFYYSETNFNSINGEEIIDYKKDSKGVFLGVNQKLTPFYIQGYLNIFSRVTNENIYQKYELKSGFKTKNFIFSDFSIELKCRYSDLRTTRNFRNYIYLNSGFFDNKIVLHLRYQNLTEILKNETGNFIMTRLILYPYFFKIKARYLYYKADSYYSALYYPEEDFYFGDFTLRAYYGQGYEYALYGEIKLKDITSGFGYSYEKRINPEKENYKFAFYIEGDW
ncbi:MAG: hypothetical protein N2258_03660 [Brevinematales bacterium]|nr:hypothetical protein [Brevinematales bacterium]